MDKSFPRQRAPGAAFRPEGKAREATVLAGHVPVKREAVMPEEEFHALLALERLRADRSLRPFVLMLLGSVAANGESVEVVKRLPLALMEVVRQTDRIGWFEKGEVLGVIFTEVSSSGTDARTEVLRAKIMTALEEKLGRNLASNLAVTLHVFPEISSSDDSRTGVRVLYPDISPSGRKRRFPTLLKRGIDIVASSVLLVIFSPLFAVIGVAIRASSKGPIIFKQQRLGQFGKPFQFLKFRSMFVDNDPRIHREYVERFITTRTENHGATRDARKVYKITNDPRVTPVGRFLRKTSLDELPQLWNVLRGELSLVGPRPPLPYEFDLYARWHRRRVFEVKPGLTGLWQVSGRSRTSFDDMVRLDLRYSQNWSLWLDLKILLATPRAVVNGNGAY